MLVGVLFGYSTPLPLSRARDLECFFDFSRNHHFSYRVLRLEGGYFNFQESRPLILLGLLVESPWVSTFKYRSLDGTLEDSLGI